MRNKIIESCFNKLDGSDYDLKDLLYCWQKYSQKALTESKYAKLAKNRKRHIKSEGEETIRAVLEEKSISYSREYTLMNLFTSKGGHPRMDFIIYTNDKAYVFVEYHGLQHFMEIESWPEFGKQQREETDPMKIKYCKENGITCYIITCFEDAKRRILEVLDDIEALEER